MTTIKTSFLLGLLAIAACCHAQNTNAYGYTFNNPISAQCNQASWDGMNSRLIYRMILKKHGFTDAQLGPMSTKEMYDRIENSDWDAKAKAPAAVQPASPASRFKPAAGRVFLPEMVKSLTDNAEYQGALMGVFEEGFKAFEKEAKKHDLTNDVAGAMAFFIGCAYSVSKDGEEPDTDGLVMLARALQIHFNTEAFRKVGDADKQKFYELMVALGTFLAASHQSAVESKDAEFGATIKTAAVDALKGFLKLDPAKLKITANGLEIVG